MSSQEKSGRLVSGLGLGIKMWKWLGLWFGVWCDGDSNVAKLSHHYNVIGHFTVLNMNQH